MSEVVEIQVLITSTMVVEITLISLNDLRNDDVHVNIRQERLIKNIPFSE